MVYFYCRNFVDVLSGPTTVDSKRVKLTASSETQSPRKSFQELPDGLQSVLPTDYSYHLQTFEELPKGNYLGAPSVCFRAKFYVKLDTETAARQWLTRFEQTSHTTYRVLKGSKPAGSIIQFKTVKHCQHFRKYFPADKVPKQGGKSLRQKKTECPSRLTLRVYSKRPTVVQKLPLSDHLCEVDLTYDHDHVHNKKRENRVSNASIPCVEYMWRVMCLKCQ